MAASLASLPAMMRSAGWGEDNALVVRDLPVPDPGPGQLLLRVRACGICGSDLHRFHAERPGPASAIAPGHEIAGEVISLGTGVAGPAPGTRVAPFPGSVCGTCAQCRRGRYPLCTSLRIAGARLPGGMAEYFLAQDGLVYPLPDGLPWEIAALTEPCAVSLHGLKRAGLLRGQRVLVLGAGAIGLFAVLVAHDAGADRIGVTARYPQQREMAQALGATHVFAADGAGNAGPTMADGWDIVVETVGGTAPTLQQAVDLCAPGGTILLLGVHTVPQALNTWRIFHSELSIAGSFGYDATGPRADFAETIALLDRRRNLVAQLVTHRLPLEQVGDAFAAALDKRSGAVKVCVTP